MGRLNVVAMIPARMGSTRLKMKNLALINGQPAISYAIRAAQASAVFHRVVVNSESPKFKEIADRYGAEFYQRALNLGSSTTKSDAVVLDFIENNPCDVLVWVNPTSPLQPAEEIRLVIGHFIESDWDSLITVQDHRVHCVYRDSPINFSTDEAFAQTQDLEPVRSFVYSLMMWRTSCFVTQMRQRGYALLCGKVGYYPVCKLSSVIIKTEEDLVFADAIARARAQSAGQRVEYDSVAASESGA